MLPLKQCSGDTSVPGPKSVSHRILWLPQRPPKQCPCEGSKQLTTMPGNMLNCLITGNVKIDILFTDPRYFLNWIGMRNLMSPAFVFYRENTNNNNNALWVKKCSCFLSTSEQLRCRSPGHCRTGRLHTHACRWGTAPTTQCRIPTGRTRTATAGTPWRRAEDGKSADMESMRIEEETTQALTLTWWWYGL